jgi:hypothetical protein
MHGTVARRVFRLMRWLNKVQVNEMMSRSMQIKNTALLWRLAVLRRACLLALMIVLASFPRSSTSAKVEPL